MNYSLILKLIGNMLKAEAVFMLFPLIISIIYGESDRNAFIMSFLAVAAAGMVLSFIKTKNKKFMIKDAFAAAALSWILFSLFGALPFIFSEYFNSVIDCIFESVSGFTTTGATILTDIESMPKGILFWRSFSQWIGAMGVLVFMLAVMPSTNASSINLLRAEGTGPAPNRVVPRVRETARIMYITYLSMSSILFIILLITGLSPYDALIHMFSTAGTGGFSNTNLNAGTYINTPAETVIMVFSFLFGISFSLYFCLFKKKFKEAIKDEELLFYFIITIVTIIIVAVNINGLYASTADALKNSTFQVLSMASTAGYTITDYNLWPALSQAVLLMFMITGCCAGSTGGGIKLIRVLLLLKAVKAEINKIIHPKSVKAIMVNGKKVDNDIIVKTALFFFIYFILFLIASLIISIEGKDMVTNTTAVIATISNIGPGFGEVGHLGNYSSFNPLSKIVFSFCMLAGRLEFLPLILLFIPSMWKNKSAE